MKSGLFLSLSIVALHAAEFPPLANTNTVTGGRGAPPMNAEQAVAAMNLPEGFKASVFAAEPDVQNALQLTWDTQGRLWVAENYTMDSDRFVDTFNDRIVILDNADGGTHFQNRHVFTDQIKHLMGFAIGYGGVWVMASPNILFIPDRDADGIPDGPPEVVYDGFSSVGGNMHTSANGLRFGIDGWIYGRTGHAHVQSIGPPGTPTAQRTRMHGSIFRFHPVTKAFEVLSSGTVNPWGQDWDKYGEHFFDSTIVGHFWYEMPGAKFVSTSAEPNLKAYELIDQIADHRYGGGNAAGVGGRGAGGGGRGQRGARGGANVAGEPPAGRDGQAPEARGRGGPPTGGRGGGTPWASGPWTNGHSVVGMMIYQGDNWPAEYRDRAYLLNLFGHRTVVETLERSGSGFVAKRPAENADLFEIPDPWYRGIDLSYGPDGGVFISDWTDTGDYHNRTGENRLSGRIYKIAFGDAKATGHSDMTKLSVEQLVALNAHANEWFPRQARVEFSNRLVDGRGIGNARRLLREQFDRETDVPRKLRSLWTLYTVGGTDESLLRSLLKSPDEHLRAWGIRLLSENWPLDAMLTSDETVSRSTVWTQQRPAPAVGGAAVTPSAAVLGELSRLAAEDPSSLVRVVLSSTLQRLPFELRPPIAAGLLARKEDATDKNLPLMVWYALIPLAETNPAALASLGAASELRATSKYIARRLAEDIKTGPDPVNSLIATAAKRTEDFQSDVVDGLTLGLAGQQNLAAPAAWEFLSAKLASSSHSPLVEKVKALDVMFGSNRGLADARRIALDTGSPPADRKAALQSLLNARAPGLREVAERLLSVKSVNAVAATALARFDDPAVGAMLVNAYPQFEPGDRSALMAALASRPSFAGRLLDGLAAGRFTRADVSATIARQIRSLDDATLTKRLGETWGEVRETPEAKRQLSAKYQAELTPRAIAAADLPHGRTLFSNTCAVCHTLYGQGGKFAPDLTAGERRHSLDSLLAKITDPSSELPADTRYTIVKLKDGRTVGGIIDNRTGSTLTVKSITESVTVPLGEIVSSEVIPSSIMPEGLLEGMSADDRRDLLAYVMGHEQVPLPAK